MMPDGYYIAKIVEVVIGDSRIDITMATRQHNKSVCFAHRYSGKSARLLLADNTIVDPEVEKLMKAQPTKPIHSHEPWKQSVKRKGRQIGKSK